MTNTEVSLLFACVCNQGLETQVILIIVNNETPESGIFEIHTLP